MVKYTISVPYDVASMVSASKVKELAVLFARTRMELQRRWETLSDLIRFYDKGCRGVDKADCKSIAYIAVETVMNAVYFEPLRKALDYIRNRLAAGGASAEDLDKVMDLVKDIVQYFAQG